MLDRRRSCLGLCGSPRDTVAVTVTGSAFRRVGAVVQFLLRNARPMSDQRVIHPASALARPATANESSHPEIDPATHVRTHLLRRVAHDIASPTGVTLTVLEELAASE